MLAECEFSAIHEVVVRAISVNGFPVEEIIILADGLFNSYPPNSLAAHCDIDLKKLIEYNQ